jgi:hypothetical protein
VVAHWTIYTKRQESSVNVADARTRPAWGHSATIDKIGVFPPDGNQFPVRR